MTHQKHVITRGALTATLYCGDCLEVVDALLRNSLNSTTASLETDETDPDPRKWCIVSDPPYGIGYVHGADSGNLAGPTKFQGVAVSGDEKPFDPSPWLEFPTVALWGANHYASRLPDSACWLVWDKRDQLFRNDQADCELAWTNLKSPARLIRHLWSGMLKDSERGQPRLHPTQKPVAVMAWCMEMAKAPAGATVLDPYMGSGTTGIACLNTGRNFIGIEKDPGYFDVALKRIEREASQALLL